jgi:hypothetical protein
VGGNEEKTPKGSTIRGTDGGGGWGVGGGGPALYVQFGFAVPTTEPQEPL